MNETLSNNNNSCEILSSYYFSNSTLSLPRIIYQGEMTLAENEQDNFLNQITRENQAFEKDIELEIFHKEHYSNEICFKKDIFSSMDKFIKIFKTKFKGYFFSHHMNVHFLLVFIY